MPPGHINAIFLTNPCRWPPLTGGPDPHRPRARRVHLLNHPAGTRNQGTARRSGRRTFPGCCNRVFSKASKSNGREYYPEAHRWAIEKKLTMLSNLDIHSPLNLDYNVHEENDHRPLTLVFAKERTREAIMTRSSPGARRFIPAKTGWRRTIPQTHLRERGEVRETVGQNHQQR